jgi:hypothetical protein
MSAVRHLINDKEHERRCSFIFLKKAHSRNCDLLKNLEILSKMTKV